MKLEQNKETLYYSLSLIGFDELELMKNSLNAVLQLMNSTDLDDLTDNQEKDERIKRIKHLLEIMTSPKGSQTAESWDGTIIRKVLEKYIKC